MNKILICTRCFCLLILSYFTCLLNISCQHNTNSIDNTACNNNIVYDDGTINSVFDIAKNNIVPCHLNADIALIDSTLRLQPEYPLFDTICDNLGLNNPIITIFGYKDIDNLILLKLYAEDMSHDHLYVLLFDNNGHFVDSISTPEPINGDQLGYEDGVPVEWHYYSNFYFGNELEKRTTSYDLKMCGEQIDTLFCGLYQTKYKLDRNKFVEYTKDSIIKGTPF